MKINTFYLPVRCTRIPPKIILTMKITAFLIMVVLVQVSAKGFGQITLSEKNAPLEKVLRKIKQQTGYAFFYDINDVDGRKVDIHVDDASLDQVLSICFRDMPISFKVLEKNVVLKKKEASIFEQVRAFLITSNITGEVSDENGALGGVTIVVKGKSRSTVTDISGKFFMDNLQETDVLQFTHVGYKIQEVMVKNNKHLKIKLEREITGLEQVVVVAYGSSRKKDLTGAVSSINAKDFQNVPFSTIDNAMAGKAAGVQVVKTDGSPGGAVRMRIRGSSSLLGGNEPLYVIDGVPLQTRSSFQDPGYGVSSPVGNDLNSPLSGGNSTAALSTSFVNGLNSLGGLNVDDIESITILKDASSTAIYGSKAANGVVIITTKRGTKDQIPQITVNYSSTVNSGITPNLLDAQQFKTYFTEAAFNAATRIKAAGRPASALINTILNTPDLFFGKENTNWVKMVTRMPVAHNASVAVQGGTLKSKYFSSISYSNTPGVLRGTDAQKIGGKISLETEIRDRFKFSTNIILGYTDQNLNAGAYQQALKARPDIAPFDANGEFTDFTAPGSANRNIFMNPLALLTAANNAKTFNLIGSVAATYDFSKALQLRSAVSLNMQTYNQRLYTPSYLTVGSLATPASTAGGIGSNSNSHSANWFVENTLGYNKLFHEKHAVNLLVGTSYETYKSSFFTATATGYPNDNILNNLTSAITPIFVRGDDPKKPQSYLVSFYARANYGYNEKYLLTVTGRADGSSKFGDNHKFGYFPSAAIGWRISKETFLKNISWINDIKFRGSYGLIGNQNIGDQMYRTLYTPVSYGGQNALIPTQLGNNQIQWENTREADAGLDISLFNDRLSATVDFYNKQTDGALISLPVAPSSSYGQLLSNAVGIRNRGLEVSLAGDLIKTSKFKWSASFNITWNNSLVTRLSKEANLAQIGDRTGLENGNTALIEGEPLGLLTGITVRGLIKTQEELDAYKKRLNKAVQGYPYLTIGDPIFALNNENSKTGSFINFSTIIGRAAPKFFGGFTQGFSYNNIDLQFYFTYSQGGQLVWGDHISSITFNGIYNVNTAVMDHYSPENPNSNNPALVYGLIGYRKSNLDVFSSSYVKLRTITVNYRFVKTRWMEKSGLHALGLFASASNVFTITSYPGLDPEVSNDPYSVAGGYFDASNYPAIRSFTLGLKASF